MDATASSPHRQGLAMLGAALRHTWPWIIAVVALCAAAPAIAARFTDVSISVWGTGAHTGKIFTAIILGSWAYSALPLAIARGRTRERFTKDLAVFAVGWSAVLGTLACVGFIAEHAYYGLFDWNQSVGTSGVEVTLGSWGPTASFAALHLPTYLVFAIAGTVIGAAAYRWEGLGWLIAFPVAIAVFAVDNAMLASAAFGPGQLRSITGFVADLPLAAGIGAAAIVAAAAALAARRLMADMPIRSRSA